MEQNKRYMVVISFDGLSKKDLPKIRQIEGFKEYLENASYCHQVRSVYPSLTYPAHTSIATGLYPVHHGVVNNVMLQPKRRHPDWFWYRKYAMGEVFYEMVEESGIPTAALFWPVSAGAKISYNMPEVLANRPWETQITASLKAGTKSFQLELITKFGKYLNGINQPELDNFTHSGFLHTLDNKDAQLFLVHYTDLDTIRHYNSFDSEEAHGALERHGKRLKEIIDLLKEKNIYEDTTLVVLGDHSSRDVTGQIRLNRLFLQMGYLTVGKRGLMDYQVFSNTCEGSAYVYIKDRRTLPHVYQELKDLKEKGIIQEIYSSEEAEDFGADPDCTFMVEAAEGFYFSNDWEGEVISDLAVEENGVIKVNGHGYLPSKKDYETVFFIDGYGVRCGVEISQMNLVDIGPTLAHLWGLEMKKVDGRILNEIIKK